jgi:hypothetical protein
MMLTPEAVSVAGPMFCITSPGVPIATEAEASPVAARRPVVAMRNTASIFVMRDMISSFVS